MTRRLYFISNALDDKTRLQRRIVTDSPAASRKIFRICQALREQGVHASVISMGRGRQDGSGSYFSGRVARVGRVPVVYLPFVHRPVLSELLSMLAFLPVLWRLSRKKGARTALFYNRVVAYLPALVLARVLGFTTMLDLEDGATALQSRAVRMQRWLFDPFCNGGALLACDALGQSTHLRPLQACYGTADFVEPRIQWQATPLVFLFGGTIARDTGAMLLIEAIRKLRVDNPPWAAGLRFEITGKGDAVGEFEQLAAEPGLPEVKLHGRTTDAQYRDILDRAHVGLALKPNEGALANTTFPSKVVEFASHDILVLSTDISDVKKVLGQGALYIESDDVDALLERFAWIVNHAAAAREISAAGHQAVESACATANVGRALAHFLFPQVGQESV